MSTEGEVRGLTRRGYNQEDARVWRESEPPTDSAPSERLASVVRIEDWGVTQDEARELLRRQMCPACGRGPWKSPLNHAAKKHGIDRFTMRDLCGITTTETVADPALVARFAELGRENDMSTVNHAGKPRRAQRWTSAGRAANVATLAQWEKDDPARASAVRVKAGRAGAAARWGDGTPRG